jgi:3-hydroxybutyryl-CoA dehydrogenase
VKRGRFTSAQAEERIGRISGQLDHAGFGEADLIIEAVYENLDLKREIFGSVDRIAPQSALLATNTSSLPIGEIATSVRDPSRFVGMHFFNPVHVMKLVEVVRHGRSDPAAVAVAAGLPKPRKTGSSSPTVQGCIERLGIVLGLEAMRMVEQNVATPADIDTAMKLGYGHPMRPLELTDLVGLDVRLDRQYLCTAIDPSRRPRSRDKVREQARKKTGEGFCKWSSRRSCDGTGSTRPIRQLSRTARSSDDR